MFELLKRYRVFVSIVFLFVAPLAVYRANAVEPAEANPLDRLVLLISSPFERLLSWATVSVSERWRRYVDVAGARKENIDLRLRLLRLEHVEGDLAGLEAENLRLRRALSLDERRPSLALVAATVVAEGTSPALRVVRIDRGAVNGVKRGQPVVSDEGLVGRVQRTSWFSAEVLLITDEKVTLDVVVTRSRVRGRLSGSPGGGRTLRIEHVQRTDDVKVGDRVSTSGLGGRYPAGVPVGTVSRFVTSPDAQEATVELTPFVDFGRLEHVQVVTAQEVEEESVLTPEALLPEALRSRNDAGLHDDAGAKPRRDAGPVDAAPAPDATPTDTGTTAGERW